MKYKIANLFIPLSFISSFPNKVFKGKEDKVRIIP